MVENRAQRPLERYLPLALATVSIVVTQVVCAAWIAREVRHDMPDRYAYSDDFTNVRGSLEAIATSLASIDDRLTPPDELIRRNALSLPPAIAPTMPADAPASFGGFAGSVHLRAPLPIEEFKSRSKRASPDRSR